MCGKEGRSMNLKNLYQYDPARKRDPVKPQKKWKEQFLILFLMYMFKT